MRWDSAPRRKPWQRVAGTIDGGAHPGGQDAYNDKLIAQKLYAFGAQNSASQGDGVSTEVVSTLDKSKTPAVAFDLRGRKEGSQFEGPHHTANIRASSGGSSKSYIAESWAVRRLTPTECERLQGFPDDFTNVPYRGKPAADGPRYKALGNSMAVNCMRWIGQRIAAVEELAKEISPNPTPSPTIEAA
jgi:DNA (cytosine-5)-methyltransferase 1